MFWSLVCFVDGRHQWRFVMQNTCRQQLHRCSRCGASKVIFP